MEKVKVYGPFISRKQAQEQGLKKYFSGNKCRKFGSVAERRSADSFCLCNKGLK